MRRAGDVETVIRRASIDGPTVDILEEVIP